jgi:predicted ATPase
MISSLLVNGYKSLLLESPLAAGNLNVLVGANASGKSSLLQMLLLLRQSADSNGKLSTLRLSGPLYEAGTALDVLNPAADHVITVELTANDLPTQLVFRHDRNTDSTGKKRTVTLDLPKGLPPNLVASGAGFAYLNAERIGPRVYYPLPPDGVHLAGLVGKQGEFTAAVLARSKDGDSIPGWNSDMAQIFAAGPEKLDAIKVRTELSESAGRLDLVANEILAWIIPGARFDVLENESADSAYLRFYRDLGATKTSIRATHIGFGLSYTLPIVAAALSLNADGLLLVENPEAHLHPFSQSRIGAFLACVAASGRQVFIETHSDHVINGVRLAVKENLISHNAVVINHFNRPKESSKSEVTQIHPKQNGRLDSWPMGFFDQIENDLSRL